MKKTAWKIALILISTSLFINGNNEHNFISNQEKDALKDKRKFELHDTVTQKKLNTIKIKEKNKLSDDLKKKGYVLDGIENNRPIFLAPFNRGAMKTMSAHYVKDDPNQPNEYNLNGEGITIGVWDGGKILDTHVEFQNDSGTTRITFGTDNGRTQYNGHATHVGGTIGAKGVNSTAYGLANKSNLISYDFGNDTTEISYEAANNKLRLSNHSYGIPGGWDYNNCFYGEPNVYEDSKFGKYVYKSFLYDTIVKSNPNYTMVIAAGNDRNQGRQQSVHQHLTWDDATGWGCRGNYTCDHSATDGDRDHPGYDIISGANGAKNIITVAAILEISNGWSSSTTGTPSSFTSYGPMDDGRIKPDISAKGVSVYSTVETGNTNYGVMSGTSMATPATTGGIALLNDYQKKSWGTTELLSSTYKAIIIHTADEAGDHPGPDYRFGWGILNIAKSIELMKKNKDINSSIIQELTYDGTEQTIQIKNADPNAPLVVTAVWIDPPSPIYNQEDYKNVVDDRRKALVNDIDIKITQTGTTHYPWMLDPINPPNAATKTSKNNTDNVEQIRIDSPSGDYSLVLNHTGSLHNGEIQTVSLIIDYAVKPTITGNLTTSTANYTVSGTSQKNTTVNIYIDNTKHDEIKSDSNGNWTKDVILPNTGRLQIQAKVSENVNLRTTNTVEEIQTTSNILEVEYNGVVINSPLTNTTLRVPSINITGQTMASTTVKILENNIEKTSLTSNPDGTFSAVIDNPNDGTFNYKATIVNGQGNTIESNPITITFDIYKPIIYFPTESIISTPTFNINGTSEPNTRVDIYKRAAGTPDLFVTHGNANATGTFNITIQPTYTDYSATHDFIASANVSVGGGKTQKTSAIKTITFNIKDYPTTLNTTLINTTIYTPTFNLTGTTKADNQLSILENGQITANGTANNSVENNGFKQFSLEMQSPKTANETSFNYKATTNIYELPRESNDITLTFDVYKPSIDSPLNEAVISTPTFNISGITEPNITVEIIKDGDIIANTTSDASGAYSTVIRYDFKNAPSKQNFRAKATVTTDDGNAVKYSDTKTYTFTVPDIRPRILEPAHNETIHSKIFYIRGTTGSNTPVQLFRDQNVTPSDTQTSNQLGEFSFTIDPTPSHSGDPVASANYKVKANVYEFNYESASITLNFNVSSDAPIITYPTEGTIVKSDKVMFRGTAKANTFVFIYNRAIGSNEQKIIGSTTSNPLGQWSFETPLKKNTSSYFIAKTQNNSGQISTLLSNEVLIVQEKLPWEPFIQSPRNFEEISTHTLPISGTGTQNSVVKIYHHTERNPTLQLLGSTHTNAIGDWSGAFKAPPNNDYFITAIIEKENYRGTSNSVAFKMNYNFDEKELSIASPTTESSTHKKTISVSGKSPNGDLHFYIDDQLSQIIPVVNNHWQTMADLPNEKTFKFQARISHNAIEKASNIVNILRNSTPKITETSQQVIADNNFVLSGIGKEKTVLTITQTENSLSLLSNGIHTLSNAQPEHIIGQVTTNENGEWSLNININAPGEYSFKVYENYGSNQQISSENYTYNILLDNNDIQLNVAPNPYNPRQSTLKIEYNFPTESNVDIGIYSISGFKVFGTSIPKNTMGAISNQRNIYVWDGTSNGKHVPPGLYIVIVKISGETTIIKTKRVGIKW